MAAADPPELPLAGPGDEPPVDADVWTEEQWLAWLRATDDTEREALPTPSAPRFRRDGRGGGGALGNAMLGLAYALYGRPDDQPAVVVEGSGQGDDEDELQVHLDRDDPERSSVVIRRRHGRRGAPGEDAGAGRDGGAAPS